MTYPLEREAKIQNFLCFTVLALLNNLGLGKSISYSSFFGIKILKILSKHSRTIFWSYTRSSEHLEMKAPEFFATFKQLDYLKNDSNMICTSAEKQQISWVWWVWLKKCACHTLMKFKLVLAGNPFWV